MTKTPPRGGRFPASLNEAASKASQPQATLRPQRTLNEAARDQRLLAVPTGLGLDSATVRQRMVERLRADGARCEPALQAMASVSRHLFVDTALATQAYEDTSLPIGLGQTISKPSVVARMIEWLYLGDGSRQRGHLGRVMEIGTGCGYQAAVLAQLSSHVLSIERLKPLHELAARHLRAQHVPRTQLFYGDGMLGYAPRAPYDSIIAAAGGDDIPQAWLDQLAVGGRLVAPATAADGQGQVLVVVDRFPDGLRRTLGEVVQFVPLKSGIK
ncbi:MAG: protein-L-isoaspartate(D-aspartate) O-methyltransferase [Burkholderiales bacterium]|nr:protein-L-isoaspartate(D-aspartate) O-methyltransferase [Burkholderiales bacterium]